AVAQFYIRANERTDLNKIVDKVTRIAEGAALMTGATLSVSNYELSYDNMITNETLSSAFTKNLQTIRPDPIYPAQRGTGSIDMENVSQVVPEIHPNISLNIRGLVAYTTKFVDQTITHDGNQSLIDGELVLAQTHYDMLTDMELLQTIREEFNQYNQTQS